MSTKKANGNPLLVAPRRKTVTIYGGDVEAELSDLLDQIDAAYAAESGTKRMGGGWTEADRLATLHDEKAAAAVGVDIVLQEIPQVKGRQLQDDCPARKGNKSDEMWGFDLEKFTDLLVPAMLVEPQVTDEQWAEFRASVAPAPWARLRDAAFDLFNSGVDLPKSSAASLLHQMREADRKPRSGTG